ncbi:MAG: nucleoside hydrolase [Alistipes sp.]|nr:nucleoside hydrolase [Alistipes sp.]MDE6624178.1 nucleoside hydrolase [Alistipes sp.]
MKRLPILLFVLLLAVSCGRRTAEEHPVRIIFDTDLGNDIDDVLALEMLLNYEREGRAELLGVTLCKANPHTAEFADGYLRAAGRGDMPLGFAHRGVTPEDGSYLLPTLGASFDGQPLLSPERTADELPEGYVLLRQLLAQQPDASVVLVAVGPLTNIGNLLASEADEISPLAGRELVAAKVKRVVTMAGLFGDEFDFPEWNVMCDVEAAQRTFHLCPVMLTTTGWEVGNRLLYPHESILNDFGDPEASPLAVAYCHYMEMPYDRQTWDLTAVLEAVEPGVWFDRSPRGRIRIADDGRSTLDVAAEGVQDYLIIPQERTAAALEALVARTAGKTPEQ